MPTNKISAKLARPAFGPLAPKHQSALPELLTLGQERLVETLSLALKKPDANQHLLVGYYSDIDEDLLVDAIQARFKISSAYVNQSTTKAKLIGTKESPGLIANTDLLVISAECLVRQKQIAKALLTEIQTGCQAVVMILGRIHWLDYLREQHEGINAGFPLVTELMHEITANSDNLQSYVDYLFQLANAAQVELADSAYPELMGYASWQCEHQQKLTLASRPLLNLIRQGQLFSEGQQVTGDDIGKAWTHRNYRVNVQQALSLQSFTEDFVRLKTQGLEVGQINALTVIDSQDFSYGEPARVTATVHYGDGEVADIERKSELGGNIHAKGMMILSACLYRIFGKDEPLHLNANIVFEQSYQEIDGDSASLAEYCALISAISEVPVNQELAVTGAIDQFGQVQAIGGVNEKVEGFYRLCQARGLSGQQGVLLPSSNIVQLHLDPEIVEAIEKEKFHLYAVDHIDQAIELLLGKSVGIADERGRFSEDSVYALVQARLEQLAGEIDEPLSIWQRLINKLT
ncbi:S16 family serine protease [Paraferrimonas sedimenticola]|uniref:endopeptidase La n=1 Tax=Paraferrimonas sedimenticola TaxID=375674 RepID=A0AA37VVE5_9GAMM|nr:S16 family serine protease [Paraferrimonas sedimenticola]GLP96011.1 ATP-dependent protease [Paraferrimonas sedimenticola]